MAVVERLSDLVRDGRWRGLLFSAVVMDIVAVSVMRRVLGFGAASGQARKAATGDAKALLAAAEDGGLAQVDLADTANGPLVLAIDCDGTLFNESGEVSERSLRAIRRFAARGGAVVLATGHPAMAIKKTAALIGCNSFVICSSGAVVMLSQTWEPRIRNMVQLGTAKRLTAAIQAISSEIEVAVEGVDHWYVQSTQFFTELDLSIPGSKMGTRISKLGKVADDSAALPEFFEASGESGAVRVLAIHPTWTAEELMRKVAPLVAEECERFGAAVELKHSGAPRGIFIGATNVHKAHALAQVCEMLGVPASRVVAFGDNMNDLEMLQWAGSGVAVANATDELKKVASKVLPFTNAEDAVAREIEDILDMVDDRSVMRDNLRRLTDQVGKLESHATALELENAALQAAIAKHESFVELMRSQSPARFRSPAPERKRYGPTV